MKSCWKKKKLKDVCPIITDGTHQTPTYFDSGYTFLSSRNVTSGKIDWSDVKHIDEEQHIKMQKRVSPQLDDILLAKNGTTGVAALVDKEIDFDIYVSLALLRPSAEIYPSYLLYYVNSPLAKKQFNKRLKGIGVPNLHLKEIREVDFIYPEEIPEQKQIVAILDEAFEALDRAKANVEQNIQNAEELFQSKLNEIFGERGEGWEEEDLKEISKIMYGHTAKSSAEFEGPKYLRITDIQDNSVDWINVPSCPPLDDDLAKYKLRYGDIVFARTGATTGKSYLVNEPPEAVFASYLIRVQADMELLKPDFLYLYFQSPKYWRIINKGISGSAQGGFNATKLGKLRIPIPPVKVQDKIVVEANALYMVYDKLISSNNKKLSNIEELKKSILQQAFSGQLTG